MPASPAQPTYTGAVSAQPAYSASVPAPAVVPASATYTEAAKVQPANGGLQLASAPTATAPTVPSYGAPTYGTAPATAPTYTAATAGAATAAAPVAQPPVQQPIPPGVTGIPILSSASASAAKLTAYPRNGQSQERQARDHYDCYQFGVAQTGYDPMRANYGVSGSGNPTEFERAQAACFEGRGYTVR
jgi:hypothetical protein